MGITKQILGINLISLPTVLSFLGSPESPPSHQVGSLLENSPSRACPGWARESRPPPHVNLGLLRGPSIHPPVGLWDSVEGSWHQTRVQMLTLKLSAARRAGVHSHPQSPFLQVGFIILPTQGSAGLACYTVGIQNVVPDLEASPAEGGPQPPCTGWQGKWVGSPPAPRRFNGD